MSISHPSRALQNLAQQLAGDPAAAPGLADEQGGEVRLDLAVGLELHEARDDPVVDCDERGRSKESKARARSAPGPRSRSPELR